MRPRRRRAGRNPKSPLQTPAVRFAVAAGVGAGVALSLDRSGMLDRYGTPMVRSFISAAMIGVGGHFLLKGRRRQWAYAAAVGALIPGASSMFADQLAPMLGGAGNAALGNGAGNGGLETVVAKLRAGGNRNRTATGYAKSARGVLN